MTRPGAAVIPELARLPGFSKFEHQRLRALAVTLLGAPPPLRTALQGAAARPEAERQAVADVALRVLAANGAVGPDQVKFAEQLYRALKLPADRVYGDLYAGRGDDDELPVVSSTEPGAAGVPIPAPTERLGGRSPSASVSADRPLTPDGQIVLDEKRLKQTRRETNEVQAFMADIFSANMVAAAMPALDTPAPAAQRARTANTAYPGLAPHYVVIVDLLRVHGGTISRADLGAIVTKAGLFVEAAIEVINDWTFDRFDEPLIEDGPDGQTLQVAIHLLDQLQSAA